MIFSFQDVVWQPDQISSTQPHQPDMAIYIHHAVSYKCHIIKVDLVSQLVKDPYLF